METAMQIKPRLARVARGAIPIVLLVGGFLAIVYRPPNRMCRVAPPGSRAAIIHPSTACIRCHVNVRVHDSDPSRVSGPNLLDR
jgi:hypothetical protein